MTSVSLTDEFIAHQNLLIGIDHLRRNQFYEAIWAFDNALELNPNDKYAHWNKAMALLSAGEYEEGFKEHDWGWRLFDWRGFGPVRDDIDRLRKLPMWEDEDLCGKHLLVYHELGFGDAIQCMRYLPELMSRADRVTLVINKELISLVQSQWVNITVIDYVPSDLSSFDFRLPFFGVMRALKQNLHNIPSQPYLHPFQWKQIKGNWGLVWAGRTNSFKAQEFFRLLEAPGTNRVTFCSLQPGPVDAFIRPLKAKDFDETMQVIAEMEHIITVDTGVAHLAGAMGHPSVHVLLPYQGDWRWWHSEVWYPTIKTYRQKTPSDWSEPFNQLNKALRQ